MAAHAPTVSVHTTLSPEFNQIVLGTGDVLSAAERLSGQPERTTLGTSDTHAVLFALSDATEVNVTLELWPSKPVTAPAIFVDLFSASITALDTQLQLTSITPSPHDLVVPLPHLKPVTVQVYVTKREIQHDDDFDLDITTEDWLIRVW